jgi:hypothetical protein
MPLRDLTTEAVANSAKGQAPLPVGTYTVEVESAETAFSPNGNEQITLVLRIMDHEEYMGRRIWQRIYLTEKSMWFTGAALQALTNGQWNPEDYGDEQSLVGLACRVTTKDRVGSDGVSRAEVAKWLPLAGEVESDTASAKETIAAGKTRRASGL